MTTATPTEQIVLNMGPQHPSTHGVLRLIVTLEGEVIREVKPDIGYLHRGVEKLTENRNWFQVIPYTDRLDYLNSMGNNLGYALAVEKLLNVEIPERAEYLRVIMAEFNRVLSHMMLVGFLLNELGAAFTPLFYATKERELILDLFEEASGSRMMYNYMRFGGVANDASDDWLNRARYLVRERLPRKLDEFEQLLSDNEILVSRTKGVGVIPPEVAIAYGVTGPMLRAVGVPYDIRRAEPFQRNRRYLQERVSETLGLLYADHWPYRQPETARGVRRSPLHEHMKSHGAVFGETAGWERANWFALGDQAREYAYSWGRQAFFDNIRHEHLAVRNGVGLYDMTSFGKIRVEGRDACRFLDKICGARMDVLACVRASKGFIHIRERDIDAKV